MEKNELSPEKYRAYFQYKTLIPINEERKQLKKITDQSGTLKKDYFEVIKNEFCRSQIRNIFLLGILPKDLQRKTYDVSFEGDGSVQLWLEKNDTYKDLYDLYIGGEGGVNAPEDSSRLFSEYGNVGKIIFEENFSTKNVKNMSEMFLDCSKLEGLNLRGFKTENVKSVYASNVCWM